MAFTGNYMCTSFKKELLYGAHDFDASSGDTFKIALYTNSATLTAATTAYTTSGEASGTNYTSGGNTLTRIDPTSAGTTGFTEFVDTAWSSASFTARGALIYNSTPNTTSISLTNPAIIVLDFGSDKVVSSGSFTVVFPTFDATNAIIRIA
jgi:hypothetical protein|tara:strand:- start:1132 stop:1584 length:453 start_codon:yes stop_codon:yes gene_type:complete